MARINFENAVYSNPNYAKLLLAVGCPYKTKGLLITAWELAQKYWLEYSGVPLAKWPTELNVLIDNGFAEAKDSGSLIYVSGSREHCKFLDRQSAAGKKGGKSRSEKKLKNLRQFKENTEAKPKPDRNQINPTEVSISNSFSNSVIPYSSNTGEVAPLPPDNLNPVALWVKAYKEKYGVRYAFQKKDFGILTNFGKQYKPDQCAALFACYLAIKEPFYENAKHPLSLFFRDLQKISVAAQTGIDPTKPKKSDYSFLEEK